MANIFVPRLVPDKNSTSGERIEMVPWDGAWQPTHRHKKRGSSYMEIGRGWLQTAVPLHDMTAMVFYQAEDGTFWCRAANEFEDGRFEALPIPKLP